MARTDAKETREEVDPEEAKRVLAQAARVRADARRSQERARNIRQSIWLRRELRNRRRAA